MERKKREREERERGKMERGRENEREKKKWRGGVRYQSLIRWQIRIHNFHVYIYCTIISIYMYPKRDSRNTSTHHTQTDAVRPFFLCIAKHSLSSLSVMRIEYVNSISFRRISNSKIKCDQRTGVAEQRLAIRYMNITGRACKHEIFAA